MTPKLFADHPKGLVILFLTEMWERFSFYGMRAILVLYMVSSTDRLNPGLGWSETFALSIYGWYTMSVYLASIPGGYLADRWFGQKKMVMAGGVLLCLGHCVLALPSITAFAGGITLIVLGVGALKSNISTMVGQLYPPGDPRRDGGFTLFYIGINVGAFTASLLVGWIGETIGWHYGFGLAGIGMVLGQIVYIWGQRHLQGIGDAQPHLFQRHHPEAKALTKVEKDRILVLFLSFLIIIVFWGAFEQAGGLMNIYTLEKVNRRMFGFEIPASVFQSLNPLFIMIFGTTVAAYWVKRKAAGKETSSLFKMAIGTMIMGTGFLMMTGAAIDSDFSSDRQAAMIWLALAYLLHTIGELCASPVALSYITKLAPAKYGSVMMGIYFGVTGLGNKVAGMVGALASDAGELETFFGIFLFTVLFSGLILLFLTKLKRLAHGADDDRPSQHFQAAEPETQTAIST